MTLWSKCKPANLLKAEPGQAVSEYALLAFWTVFIVLGSIQVVQVSLVYFYQDLASLICLPIP